MGGTGDQELRPGVRLVCPGCEADTVAKSKKRVDGWTCVGESLVCALCGCVLVQDWPDGGGDDAGAQAEAAAQDHLAAVLGGAAIEAPHPVLKTEGATPFCRDCAHFLKHPFVSRCLLHHADVDPMHDCPDFRPVAGV